MGRTYHVLKVLIIYDKNGDFFLQVDEFKDWLTIGYQDWQGQEQLRPATPKELGVDAKQMSQG